MSELVTNTIDLLGETISENFKLHNQLAILKELASQQELKLRLKQRAMDTLVRENIDYGMELVELHREVLELKSIIDEMSEWYGTCGVDVDA